MLDSKANETQRPLGITLLTGLYFFFFLVSASTYGNPFPFMGVIYQGTVAKALVFIDSLLCVYLFIGIGKRQLLSWYLLLVYNLLEIVNTIVNLSFISRAEIEKIAGRPVEQNGLMINNIAAALAILLLSQYIYRQKAQFTNRNKYLF